MNYNLPESNNLIKHMAVKKETIIIPEVTPTFTVEEATAVRLGLTTVAEILEKRKKIIN